MSTTHRLFVCAIVPVAAVLVLAGCDIPLDATRDLYSCEDDGDCISGYVCLPQDSGQFACVLEFADDAGSDVSTDARAQDAADASVDVDGSDTDTGEDADAGPGCGSAETLCEGECVETSSSTEHCGGCGNPCSNEGADAVSCVQGACVVDACQPGFVDVDDSPDNGCECAVRDDGVELCNGEDDDCDGEVDEDGLYAEQVVVGQFHSCARTHQGDVYCWGQNTAGEIGDGTGLSRSRPTKVSLRSPAVDVTAGTSFSCAVLDDGSAWCWGSGRYGRLGNAGTTDESEPRRVLLSGATFADIDAGRNHACARAVVDGNVNGYCWGDNSIGQLGIGSTVESLVPTRVPTPGAAPWVELSAGGAHSCGRVQGGTTYCWGQNAIGQLGTGASGEVELTPQPVQYRSGIQFNAIAAGGGHTCGIRTIAAQPPEERLYCWGDNSEGELGDGNGVSAYEPSSVDTLSNVTHVSAGSDRTCAIALSGTPYCWGTNYAGELGTGDDQPREIPTQVDSSSRFSQISIYSRHACGIAGDGHVRCWGNGDYGRLGQGLPVSSKSPVITSCPQ